ncbi:MAG: hypothetical protein LUQ31_08485 [Methanoregula sp.]|jgi:hypothetical protein|nr:hypothetical protein [Methanoregula sp.]
MFDRYMDAYVDRRMAGIIEEWQLARYGDLGIFPQRLDALEREVSQVSTTRKAATERLLRLEARAQALKERRS